MKQGLFTGAAGLDAESIEKFETALLDFWQITATPDELQKRVRERSEPPRDNILKKHTA
jgi:hypothetical protein